MFKRGERMDQDIKAILEHAFPDEIGLLGDELVEDLLDPVAQGPHLELAGDDRFDIAPVFEAMKFAALVVAKLFRDYEARVAKNSKIKFEVSTNDIKVVLEGADERVKTQIVESLPRLLALVEAQHASKSSI